MAFIMIFSVSASQLFAQDAEPQRPAAQEMPVIADAPLATDAPVVDEEATVEEKHTQALKARVEEIRDMDKSELTRAEKRELRKELKDTKAILQSRGIYIGGGTLILIIILIILLA